jgi:hypothetical protein
MHTPGELPLWTSGFGWPMSADHQGDDEECESAPVRAASFAKAVLGSSASKDS